MDEPSYSDRRNRLSRQVRTIPPFVGRRQELNWLEQSLQDAIAGHARVILIQGEAGVGKTRLLQEVRSDALRRGLQVCYGRGYEDLSLPYLPFVEALRALLEQIPADVEGALGADMEIIGRLLPRNRGSIPAASPSSPSIQGDRDKLQLFLAVSRVITTLAQRCPTLFILDDLHWSDRSSLDLLSQLVFTVADMAVRERVPLLIIATYRPVEPQEYLARMIARLQREKTCQTFVLPGFTEAEIHEFIRGMGLVRPSHQLIATVGEATQGNPLFIQEVLHHLMQQEALQERSGFLVAMASASDLPLPDHVTGAIVARMEKLGEGCRRVLTLAAFLGERFSLPTLNAVSSVNEDELLNMLDEGMRQRLLLSEGQMFQFVHPLIRHVFYHEPSAARRQRLHRQIAQTLECLYADSLDAHVLEIAHHLVRAGSTAEADTVVSYARRAGDQAFAVSAWSEAARYYDAALSIAESTGQLSIYDRAELHYRAGFAYYRDTDVGPSLDHYEKAIEGYRLTGDVRGLAEVLMGKTRAYITQAAVPYGTLADVRPLEEVVEALGENEPQLRGRIWAIMAEVYWHARQAAKAVEMAQRALAIGQHLQDDRLCAHACFALALAQTQNLYVKDAIESYQNALSYGRHADDLWLQGWALHRMCVVLSRLGRLDEADAVAQEAYELTRRTHNWADYSLILAALTNVAVIRGDFAAAERRTHEAMVIVSRTRYPWGGVWALLGLASARALCGSSVEAEDALDLLVEPGRVFTDAGPTFKADTLVFHQLSQVYSEAVGGLKRHLTVNPMETTSEEPLDIASLPRLCALAEIGDFMDALTPAVPPYRVLSLAAERGVLFTHGWVFLIPRVLGVAATLNQWWDKAEAHFQTAIDVATGVGAKPELGRSYLDYARMLAGRGGRNDRRRAIALLRQAAPIFDELGMKPFVRRSAQLAEMLQVRISLPLRPRGGYQDNLNAQEVEVLCHIAEGRTDQEIADDLILGRKTVAQHVSNLFNKIGVSSRTAAAAYVFEKELAFQPRSRSGMEPAAGLGRVAGKDKALRQHIPPQPTEPLRIILVTDMESSTALLQSLGDAKAHDLIGLHNVIIRDCLQAHRGTEVTHTGDGIEASFRSASNAVECALAIQRAFAKYNQEHPHRPIGVRIGLNAGEPILTEDRLFGTAVNTAFRICTRAQPGQILVSEIIRQLAAGKGFTFTPRGRLTLKGLPGRFHLYEVHWEEGHP